MSEQLRDITGTLNISDDVLVYRKTQADHYEALKKVFSDVYLILNKSNCEFDKSSLSFFGFVFSKDGVSPDPDKVKAIHDMTPPKSATEVWEWQPTVYPRVSPTPQFDQEGRQISVVSINPLLRRSKRCWSVRQQWHILILPRTLS